MLCVLTVRLSDALPSWRDQRSSRWTSGNALVAGTCLQRRLSSVHEETSAGHIGGLVRSQEQNTMGHLARRARSFQHRAASEFLREFLRGFARSRGPTLVEACENGTRTDSIDADTVGSVVQSHTARESGDG